MKILIVGGNSSLGKHLKPVLSTIGEVITADIDRSDISIDLKKDFSLPENIDVIINCAAGFGGKTNEEVLDTENINVLGTLKLCQLASKQQCSHFILISSMFVHLKEESEQTIYSISKKHSEEVAKIHCRKHSLPLTILRPSRLYGDENYFRRHQPFLYTIVDKAMRGDNIELFGTNDALRNFIHIDDITTLILKVINDKITGEYDCSHQEDISLSRICKAALKAFKSKGNLCFKENMPNIADSIFEKNNSLYEKINFYPQISIEEGIMRISKNLGTL